jgi:hypothetical protein
MFLFNPSKSVPDYTVSYPIIQQSEGLPQPQLPVINYWQTDCNV